MDMTKYKLTEEVPHASDVRYRRLFEAAHDGILILNAETGMVLDANPFLVNLLGYSHRQFLTKRIWELGAFKDIAANQAGFLELQRKEHVRYEDLPMETADGRQVPVEFVSNVYMEGGRKVIQCNIRDLTGLKRAETARRLAAVVRDSNDAITVQDFAGQIIAWNRGAELMYGYSEEEALQMNIALLTPPDKKAEQEEFTRRLMAGEAVSSFDTQRVTKDGRILDVWLTVTKLVDDAGKPMGIAFTERDVTERKRAEGRLRLMADMLDAAPTSVVVHDADGRILYGNRNAFELHGHSPEEFLRLNLRDFLPADAQALLLTRIRQIQEAGQTSFEVSHLRKDGSAFPLRIHARTAEWEGRPVILSVQTDLTERKQLEDQLRQAHKMEAIGRLAGGVAHDFNNILMVINGYSHLLLLDLPADNPMRTQLEEIKKAGDRAAALTRQLLVISRKEVIERKVLSLNDTVNAMEQLLRRLIGENIGLNVRLAADLWRAKADPAQLEQLLLNLAANARDAMPNGGELTIETANAELGEEQSLWHEQVAPGRYVMLNVSDTGIGMDAETRYRIFEPFFTTKERGKGTGLGLAIIHGIVKQNDGHIWLYSEPGHGTIFKIYLPCAEEEDKTSSEPAEASITTLRGTETVLLVEDEAAVRVMVREALGSCGYRVLEALDGEEAVQIAKGHSGAIQLLISDMIMPRMGGRELAEKFLVLCPGAKVLLISGYPDRAAADGGTLRAGRNYLQKPFTLQALTCCVREILDAAEKPN
jgi:two-component system cell cycle sensor histidine kinase/response regulator CckA